MRDIIPVVKRTLTTPTTRRLVTSNEEQNKRTLITSDSDGDIKNDDPNAGNGTLLTSASDGDLNAEKKDYQLLEHTYPSGEKYQGEFKNGNRHGKGKLVMSDSQYYEGEFKDDKMSGKGKLVMSDTDYYEGEFKDDDMTGNAIFHFEGNIYKGNFIDAVLNDSNGEIQYKNGEIYKGNVVDDKPHGKGAFKYADGAIYAGDVANGNRHGKGTYKNLSGEIYEGEFKDGNMTGEGVYKLENGDTYKGNFINGLLNDDAGQITYASGEMYTGKIKDDNLVDGTGTLRLPDGIDRSVKIINGKIKHYKIGNYEKQGNKFEKEFTKYLKKQPQMQHYNFTDDLFGTRKDYTNVPAYGGSKKKQKTRKHKKGKSRKMRKSKQNKKFK